MFDVSALLSLKPAAPVSDQATVPGMEALQTSSFSQILSTQLEIVTPASVAPEAPVPDFAVLAATIDPAGNRQPGGKILPDVLPESLQVQEDTQETEVARPEASQTDPLDRILANRPEFKAEPGAKPAGGRGDIAMPTSDAPGPDGEETAAIPVSLTVDAPAAPVALVAPIAPLAAAPAPVIDAPAQAPAPRTDRATMQLTVAPGTGAAQPAVALALVVGPVMAMSPAAADSPAAPAPTAAGGRIVVSAAALATITMPQLAATKAPPVSAPIPAATSTIALVAAQALAQQASAAAQAAPATAQTAATPVAVQAAPLATVPPAAAGSTPAQTVPAAIPAKAEAAVPVEAEAVASVDERPAVPTKAQTRAPAKVAARTASDVAAPAAAAPTAAAPIAREIAASVAAVLQPATIAPDLRQPVVGPTLTVAAPVPAENPQDFAALVDRLIAARETAGPRPIQATVSHAEFGRVVLDFRQDGGDLTVSMKSADPGFAPAVIAAMALADKPSATSTDPQQQNQPQQIQAAQQAQAGAQAQSQNQPQPQSQQQQPQSQQSGGASAQLHQEASGQRGAEGQNGQARGQERNTRLQSNPAPARRDGDSSQLRRGTYA